jgi:chromosome segregation ATPase
MVEKHTPTPWFTFGNGHCIGGPESIAGAGQGIAMCGMRARSPEEAEANAVMIVEAVNSFRALQSENASLSSSLQALREENERLTKDRNIQKAHSALRGRILQEIRNKIGPLVMSLEDEGDRIYLGSTNDKDWLAEIEETIFELDDEVWAAINREEADPYQDLYDLRVNKIPALNDEMSALAAQNEWLKDRLSNLQLPSNSPKNIEEWLEECGMPIARAALNHEGERHG